MPPTPDFRRKSVAAPTPPAAVKKPITPQFPQAPGQVGTLPLRSVGMTPGAREQLYKLGWKDGDPLPSNLAQRVKVAQEELMRNRATLTKEEMREHGIDPNKSLTHETIDIADLPEHRQKELRDLIAEARQIGHPPEETEAPTQDGSLKLAQMQAAAATAAAQRKASGQPEPEAEPASEELLEQPEVVIKETRRPRKESAAGGELPIKQCPRCLCDVTQAYDVEATADDKARYVAAILGGTRFTKTTKLLGGAVHVTYRGLTPREVETVFKQLNLDSRNGLFLGNADYMSKLQTYRFCLSVAKIEGTTGIMAEVPPLDEIPYDEPAPDQPAQTALVPLMEYIDKEVFHSESLRRVVFMGFHDFQRLTEKLEAMTTNEDFWHEIGQQP